MNDAVKQWIAALRSGRYQQGQEYLNRRKRFCCLGILCEVAVESGLPIRVEKVDGVITYNGQSCGVPEEIANWAGLTTLLGELAPGHSEGSLYYLNDTGSTFEQIADYIESQPAGLFVEEKK